MRNQTALALLVAASAVSAGSSVGCMSSSSNGEDGLGTQRATLHRAKDCGSLLADLKLDAHVKMRKVIDQQIEGIQHCQQQTQDDKQCAYGGYGYGGFAGGGDARGEATNAGSAPPQAAPTESGGADDKASSYSETNVQVKGVDEADFVKNDGQNIYVLHGNQFKIVKAWPATELGETATFTVEGQPGEMFVADGKAVIYSIVDGNGLYSAAGLQMKPAYREFVNGGGSGSSPVAPGYPGGYYPQAPMTKVTVLDIASGTPTLAREVYFEGSYLSARRVQSHVRTVLQGMQYGPVLKQSVYDLYAPQVDKTAPYDPSNPNGTTTTENPYPQTGTAMISALRKLRAENDAAIDASQLSDWLPYTFTRSGGAVTASTVACQDFYVPTAGSTESGLTEVVSIDLANPGAAPKETAILGRADTVYAGSDTLYLAAHAWAEPIMAWGWVGMGSSSGGGTAEASPPVATDAPAPTPAQPEPQSVGIRTTSSAGGSVKTISVARTHVHKFEFATDPTFPNYQASGTVVGSVKDQFALDDKDGYLRIATTEQRSYVNELDQYVPSTPTDANGQSQFPNTVNRMFVLQQDADNLKLVGDAGQLAPNEQIYSVRFVGGRGYMVTFRQVDPLFVVDLAVPTAPKVLAALKIPGFSEYMHPLDENHLLTIGRDATATGQQQGLQLQIFDVTDGANPVLSQKFTYSASEYGYSEASYNHKAFTYFADRQLLAFPYYSYGNNGMRSSLELFKVDVGAGFTKLGSIDHTDLVQTAPNGYCGGYYEPSVRRGIFMENFVYSISYGGIVATDSNDLATKVKELSLPQPTTNSGYGPVCAY